MSQREIIPILLLLTCANEKEAVKITETLLSKKLVVCVKRTNVHSSFLWRGKSEESSEILLLMETMDNKFEKVENEIKGIHSYGTFVLVALPIIKTSSGITKWMRKELK